MKILAIEIKPGMIIEHKNDYWNVLKTQHVKPGKGGAFNQVELKSITKGTKLNERFRSSENMDNENFEQVAIPKSLTEEKYKLLKENLEVSITFMEEKPISIDLPNNIECTIETTDAAIKNQTASSSYKPATLDCGINITVPPFIESGEKVIIDTRTLAYVKKVN